MLSVIELYEKQLESAKKRRRKLVGFFVLLAVTVFMIVAWYLRLTGITVTEEVHADSLGHRHAAQCMADVCICTNDNHAHTAACYEKRLVCTLEEYYEGDITADTETCAEWEQTLPAQLTGKPSEDILLIAQSQLGYCESEINYIYSQNDGERRGYTRYGEWYGNTHCEWDAVFAVFCLHYSGVSESEIPYASGCYSWIAQLKKAELFISDKSFIPSPGDLVFFFGESEFICSVAIVTSVSTGADGNITSLGVIRGDSNNSVESLTLLTPDNIAGFCKVPNEKSNTENHISTDEQTSSVEITASTQATTVEQTADEYTVSQITQEYTVSQTTQEYTVSQTAQEYTVSQTTRAQSEVCKTEAANESESLSIVETQIVTENQTEALPLDEFRFTPTGKVAQTRLYSYTDSLVSISISVPPEAGLPENAVLYAQYIPEESEGCSSTALAAQSLTEDTVLRHMIYRIGFTVDAVEVEPQSGTVSVSFEFMSPVLASTDSKPESMYVQVVHMVDENTPQSVDCNAVIAEDGSVESLAFTTDSFSEFDIMLLALSSLAEGTYGPCTFAYNDVKDAFTSNSDYTQYYNALNPLGVAGSFSLVAYDTLTLSSHCNGNILASTLLANSNFGTNNLENELTYIVNYERVNGVSASSNNHIIVIGSENTVTTRDNGNSLAVNDTKLDRPRNIIQDTDSELTPFIDLQAARAESVNISQMLNTMSTAGVTSSFADINNMYIRLLSPDGAGYYNTTASEISAIGGNARNLRMKGFEAGHDGSIIVNVDCAGFTGTLRMPNSTVWVDDVEQLTNEVTTFSNGKVIWNFINADGLTIESNRMTGMILAPGATIEIRQNLNGTVIADNIFVYAESHRTDFTGTVVPEDYTWTVPLSTYKTINGEPAETEGFSFILQTLNTSGSYVWDDLQTAVQSNGTVSFTPISILEAGTYWYAVSEEQTGPSGFSFSDSIYIIRVTTGLSLFPDIKYFALDSSYTTAQLISGNTVHTDYLTQITPEQAVFNNLAVSAYELPSTGGSGTYVFYIFGILLMLGTLLTCVFLRTSRRKRGV